jgi:hypothetical protein
MKSLKGWKHSVGAVISAEEFEHMVLHSEDEYMDLMWNGPAEEKKGPKNQEPKPFEEEDAQMRESIHG